MFVLDANNSYVKPSWWWPLQWSQYDAAGLMLVDMMFMEPLEMVEPSWRCLVDALCLHVFIDSCTWIPCYIMPWSHELLSWWRHSDGCLMMALGTWWWWHDTLVWWYSLLEPWRHDTFMQWVACWWGSPYLAPYLLYLAPSFITMHTPS